MIAKPHLNLRVAKKEDYQSLANLVHFETHVHRHLDYRPPLDWLGQRPFSILEERNNVHAALACPPDPPHVAWIQLFAAAFGIPYTQAWNTLWPEALAQLEVDTQVRWAAAIPLYNWFEELLRRSHFIPTHNIVMLSWQSGQVMTPAFLSDSVLIRPMTPEDLPAVRIVDNASFVPVWQNSQDCLAYAFHQAAVATLIEQDSQVIAYQISTPTTVGGHLARLAVLPTWQGHGLGYALVYDLLKQFERRGARLITVNTQEDNLSSLSIYRKAGFEPTGEKYAVYQYEVHHKK